MVQSRKVAAEAGVIVVGNFIVNVVAGDIVVIVLQIRTADQSTPQGVCLRIGFVHALCGGAGGRTVVRVCGVAVFIADFKGIAHGVVAQNVFHLIFCPFCECQVVSFLGVYHCTQSSRGVVAGTAVVGNYREASRRFCDPCTVGFRQIFDLGSGDLGIPQLVVHAEVLVLGDRYVKICFGSIGFTQTGPEFQIPAENIPVAGDVGDRSQLCEYAAPDGIPAVHPDVLPAVAGVLDDTLHIAGVRVSTHFAGDRFVYADNVVNVVIVFRAVVQPYCCPGQFIVVIAGGIETAVVAQTVYCQGVVTDFVVRLYGEIVQCQSIVQTLLCIFRIGVLEVQIVHRKGSCCTGGLVRSRCFRGGEISRTLDSTGRSGNIGVVYLQFRSTPVVVVVVALAHLIAVRHYIAVVVQKCGFHKVVVDPAEFVLHMLLQTGFHIGFPELIVAPAHSRSGIAARQTKLYVVAGIVPAAGQVYTAVTIGVEVFLVGIDEVLAHVGANVQSFRRRSTAVTFTAVLVGFAAAQTLHGYQRNHAVLDVTVATPCVIAVVCHFVTALVGIVEAQCQL